MAEKFQTLAQTLQRNLPILTLASSLGCGDGKFCRRVGESDTALGFISVLTSWAPGGEESFFALGGQGLVVESLGSSSSPTAV